MASARVASAIKESAIIIISFLLYLSAHTPAKGERKKAGTKPQIIDTVIINPDLVTKVICHIIAYWTSEDPKWDTA